MKSTSACCDNIARLKQELDTADAVVIGAGSGLSTSAGFTYTGERFQKYFGDFIAKYGFRDKMCIRDSRITARRWSDTDQRPFSDFFHIWNQLSTFEYPPRLFEAQRPGWLSLQYIGKDPVVNCTVSIVHCRTTKTTPCSVLAPNSAKDRLPGAITIVGITAPIAPSHRRPRYVSYV